MKSRKIMRDGQKWEIPDAFYRISIKVLIKNHETLDDEFEEVDVVEIRNLLDTS